MTNKRQGWTLRDVFFDEVREYWVACGTPSTRTLAKISKQLAEHYGEQYRHLPELGRTTVNDLLRGNREGFPATDQTSSLILSLQYFAWASGGIVEDPGPAGLRVWHERLRLFRRLGADTPAEVLDDSSPSDHQDAPAVREPSEQPDDAPAADTPDDDPERQWSLTQQRFRDCFGPYGLELLEGADDRHDPESAYRIALLLYLEGHHPREALAWLMNAVGADHFMAAQLNVADDPVAEAPLHAYRLGSFAFAAKDYDVAQIYYERAAHHGHVEAAFELGLLFIELDEPTRATYWFNRAAEGGHEYARSRFEDIHRILLGQAFTSPAADEGGIPASLTVEDLRGPETTDPDTTPPFGLQTFG